MSIDQTIQQRRKRNAGALIVGGYMLAVVYAHQFKSPDYHPAVHFAIHLIGAIMLFWGLSLKGKYIAQLEKRVAELLRCSPDTDTVSPKPEPPVA